MFQPTPEHIQFFQQSIVAWFYKFGRKNLPWQNQSPYHVWVSEIMLQQTQVATVIPYYQRFISKFPNLEALAQASLEEVLHLWTGLGYYSRARHLHRAASIILRDFNGIFPEDIESLMALPGIGRSTAGAILALGHGKRGVILDGNVKRVIARAYGIKSTINAPATLKQMWELAESLAPTDNSRDYSQAMMDLGATVCPRVNPRCDHCPIQPLCVAYQNNETNLIPLRKITKTKPCKSTHFLIFKQGSHILLQQKPNRGVWANLWCFPEYEILNKKVKAAIANEYQINIHRLKKKAPFRHTFTHFHLDITQIETKYSPSHPNKEFPIGKEKQIWYNLHAPPAIGLPAPVKRILLEYANEPQC